MFTNGLNIGLPLRWARDKKNPWNGNTDSPVKERFWADVSVKKGMLTVAWDKKWPIAWFFFIKSSCKLCKVWPVVLAKFSLFIYLMSIVCVIIYIYIYTHTHTKKKSCLLLYLHAIRFRTQFLPGSGHIDTAIWMHYMDANKTTGEEARWQLHKNAACNPEQVLAATPHKTPTVRPPAPYHENYSG